MEPRQVPSAGADVARAAERPARGHPPANDRIAPAVAALCLAGRVRHPLCFLVVRLRWAARRRGLLQLLSTGTSTPGVLRRVPLLRRGGGRPDGFRRPRHTAIYVAVRCPLRSRSAWGVPARVPGAAMAGGADDVFVLPLVSPGRRRRRCFPSSSRRTSGFYGARPRNGDTTPLFGISTRGSHSG